MICLSGILQHRKTESRASVFGATKGSCGERGVALNGQIAREIDSFQALRGFLHTLAMLACD
jgi:hypothetical protein